MINVYYFFSDKLVEFRENIGKNIEDYKKGKLIFVKENDLIKDPKLKISNFQFDMSDKSKPNNTDYENIKRFYLAFKNLEDSQATEERLWAGLCHHSNFEDYLKYRWNCQKETEVIARYFFGPDRPLTTNGLARLWWYGRMTYDENSDDPFELTRYICEDNLTLKGLTLLIYNFTNNRRIYRTYLRTLMNFEKKHKLTTDEHWQIRQKFNLLGGKILLDSLSDEELTKKINEYLNNIIKKKSNKKVQKKKITKKKAPTKKVQKKKAPTKKKTKKQNKTDTTSKINKLFSNIIKKKPKINKKCPKCSTVAKSESELEKLFGKRKVGKKEIPQSWCRKCRKKK